LAHRRPARLAARPPRGSAIPRHATGPRPWFRKDSPVIWARTTIQGQRWAAPTTVTHGGTRGGDRAKFTREAAALYLEECSRRGVGQHGVALPRQVVDSLTLKQLVAGFIAQEEEEYQGHDERHVKRYKTDLYLYTLRRWTRVEEITPDAWEEAKKELHKRAGGPLGSRSLAHLANTLRHFLRYCRTVGAIPSAPELKSPPTKDQRAEQSKRAAMTAVQRDKFLKALLQLGEDRAHCIYTVLFWSLLRQNELSALEENWIDWTRAKIHVPPEHSKSGEPEEVALHPRVRRVLRAQLHDLGKEHAGPVFGRYDFHQANTPKLKGGLFGRACLKAGLVKELEDGTVDFRGLTPHHVTRHSSATIAADQKDTTLQELMALARWRSSAMADRYLHPTVEAGRRALRRL
jgi:integrase